MPANEVEIVAAEHEGVKFHFLAAPTRIVGNEKGISHLEFQKMELGEPDASGRRRPVPIEGSETLMEVDMLVTAIGQGPDVTFIDQDDQIKELKITRWNTIDANPEILQSNIPHIFAAGDAYTGASLVVEAIGGGRRAARAIHLYLSEQEVEPVEKSLLKKHISESIFEQVKGITPKHRAEMPELPVKERIKSFDEADLVLNEEDALAESNRCLACCRLCYNPDSTAHRAAE